MWFVLSEAYNIYMGDHLKISHTYNLDLFEVLFYHSFTIHMNRMPWKTASKNLPYVNTYHHYQNPSFIGYTHATLQKFDVPNLENHQNKNKNLPHCGVRWTWTPTSMRRWRRDQTWYLRRLGVKLVTIGSSNITLTYTTWQVMCCHTNKPKIPPHHLLGKEWDHGQKEERFHDTSSM
jgi:hypothetical protein